MNPVRGVYLACLCLFSLGLILTFADEARHDWLLILPAIVAAGTYVLSPQIMWWHWQRNPPDLPTDLAPLLDRFNLYRRLDLAGKREFRRRTFLLKEATHVQGQAIDEIPADVRVMIAASAATVTFDRPEFLIKGLENIVFYRHYFPTPKHEVLHCSELDTGDGVIIWTLNVFLRSCVEPRKYLHLGLYEYFRARMAEEADFGNRAAVQALDYAAIERVSGFSETALKEFVGLPELDLAAITLTLGHTHSEEMKRLRLEIES